MFTGPLPFRAHGSLLLMWTCSCDANHALSQSMKRACRWPRVFSEVECQKAQSLSDGCLCHCRYITISATMSCHGG